ncbi:head completion [Klebsiella phage CPRSA]|nr:head completion [Klebsiella phage CPRSA]
MQNWDENLFAQLESGEGVDNNLKTEVTNKYVNWYKYNPTQQLHDSLTAEAIQMKSPDMYYVRQNLLILIKFWAKTVNRSLQNRGKLQHISIRMQTTKDRETFTANSV